MIRSNAPVAQGADALIAQAMALGGAGRGSEAAALFRQALQSRPDHAGAWFGLGMVALQGGKPQDAAGLMASALALDPALASAHMHLGIALCMTGRPELGIAACRRAATVAPRDPGIWHNLGTALHRAGRLIEAAAALERVLDLMPGHGEALFLLGEVRVALNQETEAAALYFEAAAFDPRAARPWGALGALFHRQGAMARSLAAYRHALQRDPNYAEVHNNHGAALLDANRLTEAETAFRRATELRPALTDAWQNLASLASRRERGDEAITLYRRMLAAAGSDDAATAAALDGLTGEMRRLARWQELPALTDRLSALVVAGEAAGRVPALAPFRSLMLALPDRVQLAIARRHAARHTAPAVVRPSAPPRTGAPLRIGYASADLRDHPIGHLVAGLFGRHDRAAVQVSAYAWGPTDDSSWRRRITAGCDRFVAVGPEVSDAALARRIAADGIDILVDLMGYTEHARPGLFASRPAPVQVAWLGYPGTLASPCIDYALVDRTVLPPERRDAFTEAAVYLPHTYQVTDRDQPSAASPPRAACGLPEHGFVFACFNSTYKLTPSIFAVWMRLLAAVPGSVLWLYSDRAEVNANLRDAARSHGVASERLVFAGRVPKAEHLARHRLADLFLDTLPYNAHTTASDALWAGVPLVTCPGESFAARVAASLLDAIGLSDLATPDLAGYERLALTLATDSSALAAVRARLAANRLSTPLFDTDRFARHLEAAYALMWQRHCRGLPPESLSVPE